MHYLHTQVQELTKHIEAKAAELGVKFVFGPNLDATTLENTFSPSFDASTGQERASVRFAVASA